MRHAINLADYVNNVHVKIELPVMCLQKSLESELFTLIANQLILLH